jgi:hypothetical protein
MGMTSDAFTKVCKEELSQDDYRKLGIRLLSIPPKNRSVALSLIKLGCSPVMVVSSHYKVVRAVRESYGDIKPRKKIPHA